MVSLPAEGAYVICPAGLSCKTQIKVSQRHFAPRDSSNIENLAGRIMGDLLIGE